jgi:hypothetical protein
MGGKIKHGIDTVITSLLKVDPILRPSQLGNGITASGALGAVNMTSDSSSSFNLATEYNYRERATFRFPLPEKVLDVKEERVFLAKQLDRDRDRGRDKKASSVPLSDYGYFLLNPPELVIINVFERNFFSDQKLGELVFPLANIAEGNEFRLVHLSLLF